jgi:mRNA-degrading endonuclease RelE of RelBE toxin-antitoxin system
LQITLKKRWRQIKTIDQYNSPYLLWGKRNGNARASTSRLDFGWYRLLTTIDGVQEEIKFKQTC